MSMYKILNNGTYSIPFSGGYVCDMSVCYHVNLIHSLVHKLVTHGDSDQVSWHCSIYTDAYTAAQCETVTVDSIRLLPQQKQTPPTQM